MTTLRLPTGTVAPLADLNEHDLAQYYMYQMDMLDQAEGLMSSLGIEGWRDGEQVQSGFAVVRQKKPSPEFFAFRTDGNLLPTQYDASTWQGGLVDEMGFRSYPKVADMTPEQLVNEIKKQHTSLTNFQVATVSLKTLAYNIADATQPPTCAQS